MVVSFMIVVPSRCSPSVDATSHHCYEHPSPDPTPPPEFFRGLSGRAAATFRVQAA
jgi:hypothetical protein